MRTANGGRAAVGHELCQYTTTREERAAIKEREVELRKWRRSLPKRKPRADQLPGPVTVIDMRGTPWS